MNMKKYLPAVFASGALGSSMFSVLYADMRPNIIVIMADDMGFSDIGCFGAEIQTPNLDAMARDGILFTQFYNAARSCPSRASVLTGLYPHQAGIGAMTGTAASNPEFSSYQGFLSKNCVTLGEAMSANGYFTISCGKWHVGDLDEAMLPHRRGFMRSFLTPGGAGSYFKLGGAGGRVLPYKLNGADEMPGGDFYDTDAVFDYAAKFIGECPDGKPFFAFLTPRAPHWPLHAKDEDIAKYKGVYDCGWDQIREQRYARQIKSGLISEKWKLTVRSDGDGIVPPWSALAEDKQSEMAQKMEVYAAQVDSLDQNIGKLVQFLKTNNRLDNTLILFLSDNGACSEPNEEAFGQDWTKGKGGRVGSSTSFESYGRGWAEASNTPFRLWKREIHEGGIATPFIAYWSHGIKNKGSVNRQTGHIIDIMTTCIDLSAGGYPAEYNGNKIIPMEGISFSPVFAGQLRAEHESLCWEHFSSRGIRAGKWKLVSYTKDNWTNARPAEWNLYDMEADRTEMNNLITAMPEKMAELSAMYEQWARRIGVVDNTIDWRQKKR